MAGRPGLSESEMEVLKALWDHGPGTVRQINGVLGGRGRSWAYTTVLTLLQRLGAKLRDLGEGLELVGLHEVDPAELAHVDEAQLHASIQVE